jgi:hypothetical protein
MTSIVQDIQVVRSLRKDLRDVNLPTNILNSIELIHNCIKSGTDLNGWKKIEWRNNSGAGGGSSRGYGSSSGSGHRSGGQGYSRGGGSGGNRMDSDRSSASRDNRDNRDGNTFFNSRQSNDRYEQTPPASHYAFGNRNKGGFSGRQTSEPPASIPLTNSTTPVTSETPIHTPHISPDGFRTVTQKYVSKFKKTSEKVEDTILNTILLGKLNKFSEINYAEIKEFVTHIIDGGQTEMIKCFMKLVFEKAASEEIFCPLYAKLLTELSSRYPVLLTEMANLYSVYMAIFEEVPESNADSYNEVCKQNVEKKYRRGYSQFLAELIKHCVIDTDVFMKTIMTIITQIENNLNTKESTKLIEEYADCLMKIMKAIQQDTTDDGSDDSEDEDSKKNIIKSIRKSLKGQPMTHIKPLTLRNTEWSGLSNKARFTFLDIVEGIQKF